MKKELFIQIWTSKIEHSCFEDLKETEELMAKDIDSVISRHNGDLPVKKSMILMRIVSTIFLIIPVFMFHVITVIRRMWKFIKYGGEILLLEQNEQPTIYKIYEKLKQNEPKGPNS